MTGGDDGGKGLEARVRAQAVEIAALKAVVGALLAESRVMDEDVRRWIAAVAQGPALAVPAAEVEAAADGLLGPTEPQRSEARGAPEEPRL